MIWCVLFVGLLMFNVGFLLSELKNKEKSDKKLIKKVKSDDVNNKKRTKEDFLREDISFLNNFNGYESEDK